MPTNTVLYSWCDYNILTTQSKESLEITKRNYIKETLLLKVRNFSRILALIHHSDFPALNIINTVAEEAYFLFDIFFCFSNTF